jgi:hypothetical protein
MMEIDQKVRMVTLKIDYCLLIIEYLITSL